MPRPRSRARRAVEEDDDGSAKSFPVSSVDNRKSTTDLERSRMGFDGNDERVERGAQSYGYEGTVRMGRCSVPAVPLSAQGMALPSREEPLGTDAHLRDMVGTRISIG